KHIEKFLIEQTKNKSVLDLGCGTGKYSVILAKYAKSLVGLDKSNSQLEIAKIKLDKNNFICADASCLPFEKESFDVVISCWCVGTIQDQSKQQKVIDEVKRVLRGGGCAYFVENDIGGEFEELRGRYPDTARTKNYNDFLKSNGFVECKKIQTHFNFETKQQAQNVFKNIWGELVAEKIKSNKIEHNVVIYKYQN
ncbi:MAG: class I SAM-dependent methyltransferase, partial [Clostridia bacterium]|nr:class I SAM-dependent methyltransferase [Clostridia bacterium]